MTTGEAYDAKPFVRDCRAGMNFITTGLIDPNQPLWSHVPCRYLGETYRSPRLVSNDHPGLRKRLRDARRPKILVAGLTRRVECFFDARAEYVGGVSTFSI